MGTFTQCGSGSGGFGPRQEIILIPSLNGIVVRYGSVKRFLNVERPTLSSNDEITALRQFTNWQNTLFKIRCWTFDVRRS